MRVAFHLLVLTSVLAIGACDRGESPEVAQAKLLTGGDPAKGKVAISYYGCTACHTIPGIERANGLVGPPLNRLGSRMFIGGVMTNTPQHLIQWIQDAPSVDPKTGMPNLHVTESDAKDIAGYLYTLR